MVCDEKYNRISKLFSLDLHCVRKRKPIKKIWREPQKSSLLTMFEFQRRLFREKSQKRRIIKKKRAVKEKCLFGPFEQATTMPSNPKSVRKRSTMRSKTAKCLNIALKPKFGSIMNGAGGEVSYRASALRPCTAQRLVS